MKNLFKTIILVALALSCAKEAGNESISEASRRYSLSFDPLTKTTISGTGSSRSVSWNEGDVLQFYTESNKANPSEATVCLSGNNAYVTIPRGRTDEFINAVYGAAQLSSSSSTDNCMYVSSPVRNEQSYTAFSQAHLCAAFSADIENPDLTFHNAAAIVKFTSSAKVGKLVFYGNNGETITGGSNGNLKISHAGGALTVVPSSSGGRSVTVQTDGQETDFYLAILPVNFSGGITAECFDTNLELIATRKTTNAINTVSSTGAVKIIDLGNVQDWVNDPLPDAIDLGLSVKWARVNLGATEPEDYGDYFAWGETAPKSSYTWSDYSFGHGKNGPFSKYVVDENYGTVDHKTVLDTGDDAAHVLLGDAWRLPSREEVQELMNNCTWSWTTRNGVPGYRVTSKKSGYTGASIFLPANGMRTGSSLADEGVSGNYWSSSTSADGAYFAVSPYFSQSATQSGNCYRYFGLGIRPVYGAVVPVTEITLPETMILTKGIKESATLTATVLPEDATYKNLTWESSDKSIATVDANGKVTAVALGSATITVYSADGEISAQCKVTVIRLVTSITLDKTELEIYVGDDPAELVATVLPEDATNKSLSWTSSDTSVATVDEEGRVTAVSSGFATITATACDGSGKNASCNINVYPDLSKPESVEAVDLGLSVKWASCNVGASNPEEYGAYFAWGETEPKYDYSSDTYKWCNGDYNKTKYCPSGETEYWDGSGSPDNKTVLEPEDDAATANWGGSWRMPTDAEWTELRENCTWTWTNNYNGTGIAGRIVTSNKVGYTEKSIFLPAATSAWNDSGLSYVGSIGCYWSSSLDAGIPITAWTVNFDSGSVSRDDGDRTCGLSVRPVYGERIHPESVKLSYKSLSICVGSSAMLTATVLPENVPDKGVLWSSDNTAVATVDHKGFVSALKEGTATISVSTVDGGKMAECVVTVVPMQVAEAIDLGLSVKWASFNLGSTRPEVFGSYFAWGETEPKSDYYWSTYKWCNGSDKTLTKYCTSGWWYWAGSGSPDGKTVLDLEDDAAHVNWGDSWRMPTDAEWTELREYCTWTWTSNYNGTGIKGAIVTSKKTGYTDKSIFLPAAGHRGGIGLDDVGSIGRYWSPSLATVKPIYAWYVYFGSGGVDRRDYDRCLGQSVRPVTE